jgi:hypothetical protein
MEGIRFGRGACGAGLGGSHALHADRRQTMRASAWQRLPTSLGLARMGTIGQNRSFESPGEL